MASSSINTISAISLHQGLFEFLWGFLLGIFFFFCKSNKSQFLIWRKSLLFLLGVMAYLLSQTVKLLNQLFDHWTCLSCGFPFFFKTLHQVETDYFIVCRSACGPSSMQYPNLHLPSEAPAPCPKLLSQLSSVTGLSPLMNHIELQHMQGKSSEFHWHTQASWRFSPMASADNPCLCNWKWYGIIPVGLCFVTDVMHVSPF